MSRDPNVRMPEPAAEELVEGILGVLDRSYDAGRSATGLAEFFRGLDRRTLRAIAYQHGVFEGDLDPDPADEPA